MTGSGTFPGLSVPAAARPLLLGETSTAIPNSKSGAIEVTRTLRVTRCSVVKARTQAFNNLFGIMIRAPSTLRGELVNFTKRTLVKSVFGFAPRPRISCP